MDGRSNVHVQTNEHEQKLYNPQYTCTYFAGGIEIIS